VYDVSFAFRGDKPEVDDFKGRSFAVFAGDGLRVTVAAMTASGPCEKVAVKLCEWNMLTSLLVNQPMRDIANSKLFRVGKGVLFSWQTMRARRD